jgi:hypothetical protein
MIALVGVLAALTATAALRAEQASAQSRPTVPHEGVLLLKNGQVLSGRITWSGDHYFVDRDGLQMGVRAGEVLVAAKSLDDAYDRQRARLANDDLDGHQALAQWCLRHDLLGYAAAELADCSALDPRNRRTEELRRQLQSAVRLARQDAERAAERGASEPARPATDEPAITAAAESKKLPQSESSREALASIPVAAAETFVTTVQPLLINQCAGGGCHGGANAAQPRLLRFDPRKSPSRVYTERNLAAALKYVDRDNPDVSPLLLAPSRPHGRAKAAIFTGRSLAQQAELANWIRHVAGKPVAVPESNAANARLDANATTGDVGVRHAGYDDRKPAGHSGNRTPNERIGQGSSAPPSLPSESRSTGDDPHNPDAFNRRYFPNGPPMDLADSQDTPLRPREERPRTTVPRHPADVRPSKSSEPRSAAAGKLKQPLDAPRRSPATRHAPRRPMPSALPKDEIPPFESIEEGEVAPEQAR